ncbi:MAG TPA: TonB family protein [Terriglobia bacterium]|nr:TonB family protein [Terriglobia bacterium]
MTKLAARSSAKWLAALWVGLALSAAAQQDAPLAPQPLGSKAAGELLVNRVKPDYPAVAQINYIQGQVRVVLTVGADGHVRKVHVLEGNPLLAASAVKAIQSWVYRPFVTAAGPAPFSTLIKVNFSLREKDLEHSPSTPERDLAKAVKPPEVLDKPAATPAASSIRLQVLVDEDGRAIDSRLLAGPALMLASAQRSVAQWAFRPARWGNLTVPWYLEVDVPVEGTGNLKTWASPPKP